MVRDAESHAADDKARREVIDVRNQADSLAWSVEKTLNESRDKVPASEQSSIEAAIAAVREAVKGDDAQAITLASEALQKAQGANGAKGAEGAQGGQGAEGNHGQPAEGEVVDAEFAETK